MQTIPYYSVWSGLFVLCAGLGFVPEPQGFWKWLLVVAALAFFLPPFALTRRAAAAGDRATLALVRNLSVLSLALTVAALIGNFFSVMAPEAVGNALYALLVIVSTPMICRQYWILSLFLWACLLIYAQGKLRTGKRRK